MAERIGHLLYTNESLKEQFKASVRPLSKRELDSIVTEGWADVALVAHVLSVCPTTVRKWIKKGKVKAEKGPNGQFFIPLEQFRGWFDIVEASRYSPLSNVAKSMPPHMRRLRSQFAKEYRAQLKSEGYAVPPKGAASVLRSGGTRAPRPDSFGP